MKSQKIAIIFFMTMDKIYNESWKIGDIEIKNKIVLAPMAGITNKAFLTTDVYKRQI